MKSFWEKVSAAGVLVLSLPVLAVAAGAARAEGIPLGKADLSTPAGVEAFTRQVDEAAARLCRDASQVGTRIQRADECKKEVWNEVMGKLSAEQKLALKAGQAANLAKAGAPSTSTIR